jgi:thiol peroxidase
MAQILYKGTPVHTTGELPAEGSRAPDFVLTKNDFSDVGLGDFAGKIKILNIVPSLDTDTCAASAKRFNEEVKKLDNTVVLTISADLPYAQKRFCEAESIDSVVTLSQLRNREFGRRYGIEQAEGQKAGLLARAVVVIDENDTVRYTQLVPEISQEPDYDAVLEAVSKL